MRNGFLSVAAAIASAASATVFLPPRTAAADGAAPAPAAGKLALEKGDRIAIIGNTLAERLQHFGHFETFLHARFPNHNLVVRNLAWSADEVALRPRQASFGGPDQHLTFCKADVVFAFFGFNESFAGPAGLPKFEKDLRDFIAHTKQQKYNGKSAPRLVLFSPIPHEDLGRKDLPDGKANNANIRLYAEAMAKIAAETGTAFVDLYAPTLALMEAAKTPEAKLTINGIHLSEKGDAAVGAAMDSALFGSANPSPIKAGTTEFERLRAEVNSKSRQWWFRYRSVNGAYIYGGRADVHDNRRVMDFERRKLDEMVSIRDARIWALGRGEQVPDNPDDGKTLALPEVPTNFKKPIKYLPPEEAIKTFTLPKGYEVNLYASEVEFPELAKPVQMTFDAKGRCWVIVMPSYPQYKPPALPNDKVLILEDTKGAGKADKCSVFADGLHVPTGIELGDGGAYVAQQPNLMFLKDTDGDGKADERRIILHGFDTADSHHSINAFHWGPGGDLFFAEGVFHYSQVETPYGPVRAHNSAVFRYEPRTEKFDVFVTYNFANPWGIIHDRWGQTFIADASTGNNYFAAPFSGHVEYPTKHPAMKTFIKKRMRPSAGCEIVTSRAMPDDLQGNFLLTNCIGFQGVLNHRVTEDGSGFVGTEVEPLIFSSDPNFRPVDVKVGPDGAIYVLDWHNALIGHLQHSIRDPNRDTTHGRIWRITHKDHPVLKPAKIAGEPIPALLDLLKSYEDRTRYAARLELRGRDTAEVLRETDKWLAGLDKSDKDVEHHRLEALWVRQHHNAVNADLLKSLLASPEPHARAAAVRVLCYWRDRVPGTLDLLRTAAADEHPRVRLEAVRACSFFKGEEAVAAADIALSALKKPADEYIEYCLKETMATLEPYWKKAISAGKPLAADNPAGINYILKGIPTSDLIVMPRNAAVYHALLSRPGVVHQYRHEALMGLAKLNGTDLMTEALAAVERIDGGGEEKVLFDLAHVLTAQKAADLAKARDRLEKLAAAGRRPLTRQVAYAALVTADGGADRLWDAAAKAPGTLLDLVQAVAILPDAKLRAGLHARVRPLLDALPEAVASQAKSSRGVAGRFVRIDLPGDRRTLTLAEVQVFSDGKNIAPAGKAKQSSVAFGGDASKAIDGKTGGAFADGGMTHTKENEKNPWWELDLGAEKVIETVAVWNRVESSGMYTARLDGFTLTVLDAARKPVFTRAGIPAPAERGEYRLGSDAAGDIRRAAMDALVTMPGHEAETFAALAGFIRKGEDLTAAVRAVRRLPASKWPTDQVAPLASAILEFVSKIPAEERTEPAALDALQLGKDLATRMPAAEGKPLRAKLNELGINVVTVRTVPHKMAFDRARIYVEAGKPVEVVLDNTDIMPHNLVICLPGASTEVGTAADSMAPLEAGWRNYIPPGAKILKNTRMLEPGQTERLRFTAPKQPGEYPFICTFPGHWRTMAGVMRVVPKLDDVAPEELNPPSPAEGDHGGAGGPAPAARAFIRKWTAEDLAADLERVGKGRDYAAGKALFAAASCNQCHRMCDEGGMLGPNLAELPKKLSEKKLGVDYVLGEILAPSKNIDDKYKTLIVRTSDGQVVSGVVVESTPKTIKLKANPQAPETEVKLEDIEEKKFSPLSAMPEGLLNTLTKEEILDLLAFVTAGGDPMHPCFKK